MGIFSLTSKKASVTLVFLIVSVLVISSGAVIVHEIKKANDGEVGTGLALLDEVQHIEEEQVDNFEDGVVDNSNSFVVYESSSKDSSKSSRSKKSSSSSSDKSSSSGSPSSSNLDSGNEGLEEESLNNEKNESINDTTKSGLIDGACKAASKETNEGPGGTYCQHDDYEECFDYFTRSTVYACKDPLWGCTEFDIGTDYCIDFYTLNEAFLNCGFSTVVSDYLRWQEKDCSDFDGISDWFYYCEGDEVRKHKYRRYYKCSDGACKIRWQGWSEIDDELVSKKGDDDYCNKRRKYTDEGAPGCSLCGHGDYDCDYNFECSGSLVCMGSIFCLGWECGCCWDGETWDKIRNKCCECDDASDPCCDGCNYESSSSVCNSHISGSDQYKCGGNCLGSDILNRYKKQYCSGTSSLCNGNIAYTTPTTLKTCGLSQFCSGSTSWQTTNNMFCKTPQCSSGLCCDTTCGVFSYKSSSVICQSGLIDYGCPWGTSPGNDVGKRTGNKYCSGSSASCTGSTIFGSYSRYDDCTSSEYCVDNNPVCQVLPCSCGSWQKRSCGYSTCSSTQMGYTRTCTPSGCDSELKCLTDSSCLQPGDYDYCSTSHRCSAGYGDCDSDDECATGLICKQNVGANYGWASDVDVCESTCECTSGPCCDGCNYKTSGAQPTGYADDTNGFCTGTEGVTSTSYVYTKNYYCNGNDADEHHTDSLKDTCGTCEYCTNNDLTCNYYSSSATCSSLQDCDYLNNYHITGTQGATSTSYCKYANYNDNYRYCDAAGSCSSLTCPLGSDTITATAGTCKYISGCSGSTSGTVKNYASGTSCGTNKECDGNGNCVTISIVCFNDGDCGTDEWVGSIFCSGEDVYQDYRTWACNGAGTTSSTCSYVDTATLKKDCGEDYCEDWEDNYCSGDDVYHSRTCHDIGCSNDDCVDSTYTEKEKVQECGTAGCSNGACNIACFSDGDCGTDEWVGSIFCLSDNIYQKWRTYSCDKPGTVDASCSYSDQNKKKQDCGTDCYVGNAFCKNNNVWQIWRNYICTSSVTQGVSCSYTDQTKEKEDCGSFSCSSWGANYCKGEDVYHKRTCYYGGCSNGICYNNLNTAEQEALVQTCSNGCTENRCKREVCIKECNFGVCYEYCEWQ